MQLYAISESGAIFAADAKKKKNYQCAECGSSVRVRRGAFRKPHFFHIRKNSHCREANKSLLHLELQKHLLSLLGEGAAMEVPFSSINRIADVFWPSKKVVFEIQCSPMSEEEAKARSYDYASLGLQVVWLLRDRVFRKNRHFLRQQGAYLFREEKKGRFFLYDEWNPFSSPYPVSLHLPKEVPQEISKNIPPPLLPRLQKTFYFTGDLLDRTLTGSLSLKSYTQTQVPKNELGRLAWQMLQKPFRGLWEILLRGSVEN